METREFRGTPSVLNRVFPQPARDPREVVRLAILWGTAYDRQYDALRKNGRIQTSTPDSEKIFEAVSSKLNPLELAKDKSIDALLKKYLPMAAPVLEWASSPIAEALKALFDSSEIASDYDELKAMNDDIQQRVAMLLASFMKPDWRDSLKRAVEQAGPQLRMPSDS